MVKFVRRVFLTAVYFFILAFLLKAFLQIKPGVNGQRVDTKAGTDVKESRTERTSVFVKRVIDGDTIELSDGARVRYIGMDTPEVNMPLYEEAKTENKKLVEKRNAILEFDRERFDKYGRTLAYVYVGDLFINKKLIEEGLAKVMTVKPNILHEQELLYLENKARNNCLNLWRSLCKR